MIEAAFKAFARALRHAVAIDPTETGVPPRRDADRVMRAGIAVIDYGMGNRRSVEKALERVGAEVRLTDDHAVLREADGLVVPGVGAFPEAMRRLRAAGLDELIRERAADVPVLGLCLGMQLLYEGSDEFEGAEGLGLLSGRVRPLDAQGLKLPHIGWHEVEFVRSTPLTPAAGREAYYHVHSYAPERTEDTVAVGDYGDGVRLDCRARPRLRLSISPREVLARRSAPAEGVHPALRAGGRVILYPAIDISDGKAVRLVRGDFDAKTIYEDDPLEAGRTWVAEGARFLHVVDLDGAREGKPVNLHHLERITTELSVPVQYGGGLRTLPAVRDALRAGAERVILGTAAFTDIDFLDDVLGAFRDRVVVSSIRAPATSPPVAGRRRRRCLPTR